MLGIIEILMFVCGLWALISGKLPTWAFGKRYQVVGTWARVVGAIWMVPLSFGFTIGFLVGLLTGGKGVVVVTIAEIVLMLIAFIIARVLSRRYGQLTTG